MWYLYRIQIIIFFPFIRIPEDYKYHQHGDIYMADVMADAHHIQLKRRPPEE